MKDCDYCGHANEDGAVACSGCGTPFPQPIAADATIEAPSIEPDVVAWFRRYAALLCGLGAFLALAGTYLMVRDHAVAGAELRHLSTVLLGATVCTVHGIALSSSRKRWLWTYSLVVIALGMGSCFLPFCVPMLIRWARQDTKNYFTDVP